MIIFKKLNTYFIFQQCPAANPLRLQSHHSRFSSFFNIQSPHSTIPSPASNSQTNNSDRSQSVSVPQNILDTICRQHTHLINLHRGHDLWEQADMYMTRSNLRGNIIYKLLLIVGIIDVI